MPAAFLLIGLGIVLLLQTTGIVPWELWNSLWRFWPVVIVAFGLNILLSRRAPLLAALLVLALFTSSVAGAFYLASTEEAPVVTSLTEPLGELESAIVRITFGGGELKLTSLPPSSPNLVEGRLLTPGEAATATLRRTGSRGDLRLEMGGRRWLSGFAQADWELALARSPQFALEINGAAAKMSLDLRDLHVTELDIDTGASDVEIIVPARAGETRLNIDARAANIEVLVTEGVAAQISTSNGLAAFSVDRGRFPESEGGYASPGFGTAENRVTMAFNVGAANVTVR